MDLRLVNYVQDKHRDRGIYAQIDPLSICVCVCVSPIFNIPSRHTSHICHSLCSVRPPWAAHSSGGTLSGVPASHCSMTAEKQGNAANRTMNRLGRSSTEVSALKSLRTDFPFSLGKGPPGKVQGHSSWCHPSTDSHPVLLLPLHYLRTGHTPAGLFF